MAWGSHSEKEIIIGKVILEISRKNDVHNNYETDYIGFESLVRYGNLVLMESVAETFILDE